LFITGGPLFIAIVVTAFQPEENMNYSRCLRALANGLVLAALALSAGGVRGQEPKKEYAQSTSIHSEVPAKSLAWDSFGPNAKTFAKEEPEGARITLPAGQDGLRPMVGWQRM